MNFYFRIDPVSFAIVEKFTRSEPIGPRMSKEDAIAAGIAYIVDVAVTDPAHDSATQIKEGPVDAYDEPTNTATRVYTVRDKTTEELTAEAKASVAGPSVHNIQTGFRLGGVLVWDSVLTKAELDTFYNTTKDRYGL